MRVELRKLANGQTYYSFVYCNGPKRIRLKKGDHPQFKTREEASEWAKSKEADLESARARVLQRLKWKTQYYSFAKISDEYINHCKKVQPNSWKNTAFYLDQYVFPYFLEVKKSNNPNNWSLHFEDFKTWLEESAMTVREPRRLISYSTKNHCIRTLNTFLEFMAKTHRVERPNIYKVTGYAGGKINSRNADALIPLEEFKIVHGILKETNRTVATFFQTAYFTAMRFNEIYGLSLDDLFIGEIEDGVLKPALDHHNIEYFGYIVLESQPKTKVRDRLSDGTIKRKPLKGKTKIDEKFNRIIPIIDKDLFNNLVALYMRQEELFKSRTYGSDRKNYVLFDGLTTTEANLALRQAFQKTKYNPKSYHCCRHTRCTELVGKTRDFVLARYWLGHARQETTLRYTHIYQQSSRIVRKKNQKIEFIE
jgi:integrase